MVQFVPKMMVCQHKLTTDLQCRQCAVPAVNDLHLVLEPFQKELSGTAKSSISFQMCNLNDGQGQHYHFAISDSIVSALTATGSQTLISCGVFTLQFNVDSLPLFKSSSELRPLLF
jgi:hypothetical protein